MVTALGDMVTLPALYLATFLVRNDTVNAIVRSLRRGRGLRRRAGVLRDMPVVRRIVLEMTAVDRC